jgi:arginase
MNVGAVAEIAESTAKHVSAAFQENSAVLVLGGDCTVELGTIAGALAVTSNIGLVYIDLDTDLNTPESVDDGALDWMGISHMLGIQGSVKQLVELGPRVPLLQPDQVHFFANDNSKPFEREIIESRGISEIRLADVAADPAGAAQSIVDGWAKRFDRLLVHLDVDVLDYLSMPLAENTRRNEGLRFGQLMAALQPLLCAPNWAALTICEINPDHGEKDGSTLRAFTEVLADALSASPPIRDSLQ